MLKHLVLCPFINLSVKLDNHVAIAVFFQIFSFLTYFLLVEIQVPGSSQTSKNLGRESKPELCFYI